MEVDGDYLVFSTGKRVYTNSGIIGLCEPHGPYWDVTHGYDGGIYLWGSEEDDAVTKQEAIELCDYMIGLWKQFKVFCGS